MNTALLFYDLDDDQCSDELHTHIPAVMVTRTLDEPRNRERCRKCGMVIVRCGLNSDPPHCYGWKLDEYMIYEDSFSI